MTRVLTFKAWLGGAGLVTGLVGMATTQRWLVWVAVTLLGAAFTLRFAERKAHSP
jgi:membrane protein implicated in regulation of membrane protease activity